MPTTPPLFIVGAPRSGNTLTRRVLMASGQIYIPPETYVFGEIISRWPSWRGLPWREKVWLVCAYFDRHPHFSDYEIESFSPFAEEAFALPKEDRHLHRVYDLLYAFMARSHGYTQDRWGDKTPWNTMYLDRIIKAYPDAYFLHLKRDGRDVVASQVKADMRDIEHSAERWVSANQSCKKNLKRAKRPSLEIAYEDLVTKPEEIFAQIFDWADLSFDPDYLIKVPALLADVGRHSHHQSVNRPITPSSIGKWRQSLTPEDFSDLPDSFSNMMTSLGYHLESDATLMP